MGKDEYQSIDDELKANGWRVIDCVADKELPVRLSTFALEITQGHYDDFRILAADYARRGENWIIAEPSHLFYVKLSRQQMRENPYCIPTIIYADCRDKEGHLCGDVLISSRNQ